MVVNLRFVRNAKKDAIAQFSLKYEDKFGAYTRPKNDFFLLGSFSSRQNILINFFLLK